MGAGFFERHMTKEVPCLKVFFFLVSAAKNFPYLKIWFTYWSVFKFGSIFLRADMTIKETLKQGTSLRTMLDRVKHELRFQS